jgi:hypothetical protein
MKDLMGVFFLRNEFETAHNAKEVYAPLPPPPAPFFLTIIIRRGNPRQTTVTKDKPTSPPHGGSMEQIGFVRYHLNLERYRGMKR